MSAENSKRRALQFSLLHLLLVLTITAAVMPPVMWWIRSPGSPPPAEVETAQRAFLKKLRWSYECVTENNEQPRIELTHKLSSGDRLQLLSTKRKVRETKSGEIVPELYQDRLILQYARLQRTKPETLWTYEAFSNSSPIIGYSDPYGFVVSESASSIVALAFLDERGLYFAEIDVNNPVSTSATTPFWETYSLTQFVIKRFGDANWEPRFSIRNLKRESDGWSMEVGIKGETLLLKRTGYRQWVELPSTVKP